jgi:hypothetical protein
MVSRMRMTMETWGEIGGAEDESDDETLPDIDGGEPLVCAAKPAIDSATA